MTGAPRIVKLVLIVSHKWRYLLLIICKFELVYHYFSVNLEISIFKLHSDRKRYTFFDNIMRNFINRIVNEILIFLYCGVNFQPKFRVFILFLPKPPRL